MYYTKILYSLHQLQRLFSLNPQGLILFRKYKYFFQYFLIFIIPSLLSLAMIPTFHHAYHSPKNLLLISLIPLALTALFINHYQKQQKLSVYISLLEIVLLIRISWLLFTNPELITHPSNLGFWILLSLMLLSFLSRYLHNNLSDPRKLIKYFLKGLWISGSIQMMIGFIQFFKYAEISKSILKTPMLGFIGTVNGFGLFMVLALIALVGDVLYFRYKTYKIGLIMLFVAAILLNGSRGAILGLLVSTAFILIVFYRGDFFSLIIKKIPYFDKVTKKTFNYTIVLLGTAIVLLITFTLVNLNIESSRGRIMIWKISLPMFSENPITGIGHGNYARDYLNYQTQFFNNPDNIPLAWKAANLKQAHNEYLQAFCESGSVGGLLFLAIWIIGFLGLVKRVRDDNRIYIPILTIYLTILVHAFVDGVLHVLPVSVIMYIILGFTNLPARKITVNSKYNLVSRF